MKTILVPVVVGLLVVTLCAGTAAAQERLVFASLPVEYQTLLATWLSQDCRVGSKEIEQHIISAGQRLEEALWEAFELGPTEEDRADLQHSLGERYALRHRWLLQNGPEAVGPVSEQLLAESEEAFRAAEDVKLTDRWRDAAVGGLGLVCTERSRERLSLLARDERDPSSIAARAALETSGGCRRR